MNSINLFDVNGNIGRGAYDAPEFPKSQDLLAHMDYLGVDRALVWHVLARDLAPAAGNRQLLEEVGASEELKRRLIPAQVVTPANAYESGGVDKLLGNARISGSRAFRLFPKTSRFNMSGLRKLFTSLAELNPVVFWGFRDSNGRTDTLEFRELAEEFANYQFVLTELMWGEFPDALDLMERLPNVSIDISWLHMRDTIELLVELFGPERVLFGTGGKTHYGASVAVLAHAKISDSARELIAHGNVERLLGLPPLPHKLAKTSKLLKEKPLWNEFRQGRPVKGAEIIDVHAHTPPWTRGWVARDNDLEDFIPSMLAQMDDCGVSRAIMIPEAALFGEPSGNLEAEKALSKHPDRFSGNFAYNPLYNDELTRMLDDTFSRGFFVGFKILPAYWRRPVTDPGYVPMWEFADRHHLPILIHTWGDAHLLRDIAPKYPGAVFVLGHSNADKRAEAVELARRNPNILLEFCGSFTAPIDWVDTIAQFGNDRIVFGSDTGAHSQAWELGRLLSIPLPDKVLKPILADNFKRAVS